MKYKIPPAKAGGYSKTEIEKNYSFLRLPKVLASPDGNGILLWRGLPQKI